MFRLVKQLTTFDGEDGEVVHRVGLAVQLLGRADDAAQRVHVEEALHVRVAVDGVPAQHNGSINLDKCDAQKNPKLIDTR